MIKHNVYLEKLYFTCENIKINLFTGEIGCPDFLEPTRDFQTPIIFLLVDKNTKCGYFFLNWVVRNILATTLSGFPEIFIFLTTGSLVSVLEDRHITHHHNKYDVI